MSDFFKTWFKKNGIRALMGLKAILIGALILTYTQTIYIGDLPITAQEEKEETNNDNNIEATETQIETQPVDSEKSRENISKDEVSDAGDLAKNEPSRRSFLDDLLELPILDRKSVKSDELGRYLTLAEQKLQQIEERKKLIEQREEQLINLENSITKKLKALQEERRFFTLSVQKEKQAKQDRLEKLVLLYQKMEPKKAGPVFAEMDRDLVVALFNSLPEKQITKILEAMDAEKAVKLSEYYGRIKSGKEYELLKEVNNTLIDEFNACKGMAH